MIINGNITVKYQKGDYQIPKGPLHKYTNPSSILDPS
eukprot:UN25470